MASVDRQERIGIAVPVPSVPRAQDLAALRATLESVRDQTDPDFEVVVVAATDAPSCGVEDDRIRTVPPAGPGPVGLLEAGLGALPTRWIRFLPVGDLLAPRCLEAERAAVEASPDLAAVFSGVEIVDEEGRPSSAADQPRGPVAGRHSGGALLPELVASNPLSLGSALLHRETLIEEGGFDASFEARPEHELWLRLAAGHAVAVLPEVGLRLRRPALFPVDPVVDGAEHARAVLRALRGDGLESAVAALGGGDRGSGAQGVARTELARRLLRAGRLELAPLVHRLVREARGAGVYYPADAPFEELAAELPELARPEGWFPPAPVPSRTRPIRREATTFPAPIRIALGTAAGAEAEVEAVGRLASRRDGLAACGIELIVLHARGARDATTPRFDLPLEILRHRGSVDEIEAVLDRHEISLLIAAATHPAMDVAARAGVAVRSAWPDPETDEQVGSLARELIAAAAAAAAERRRVAHADRVAAARAADAGRFEEAALRTLAGALGDAGVGIGTTTGADGLLDRLADSRRDAGAAHRRARQADLLARRALDKLRIGRRLRATFRPGGAVGTGGAPVLSLDPQRATRFLATAAAAGAARLWAIYTTDPYSETQGQRSTWIARELLARGDFVVFFYWRWNLCEEIAEAPHDRCLSVPIDQFFRLQRPLMDLAAPGLEKILLIEFPDAYLFEQIDLANTHGFTTVYDCIDDWEEFARVGQAHWYDPGVERHLVRNADVVVATHPVLAERTRAMGRRAPVPVVPNGVALDSLAGAPPRERTGAPVIGYFGHLTSAWFDWDLVFDTARDHPEWTFEVLGHGAPEELDRPANVRLPGPVAHDALEEKTRGWHVGMVPFRPGRLTRAVDPIKLYEYLALALPSVVVDMPHLRGVPGVEVCTRADFASALARALAVKLDRRAVSDFVESSRWTVRTDALWEAVAEAERTDLLKAL